MILPHFTPKQILYNINEYNRKIREDNMVNLQLIIIKKFILTKYYLRIIG